MLPVAEALEKLSDRLVHSLIQSAKIRDWAVRLGTRKEMMAAGRPGGSGGTGVPIASAEAPTLSFLASLEDANRNQVLEAGEAVHARVEVANAGPGVARGDRKSTRLNSSHLVISYAVFCLKKKTRTKIHVDIIPL